MWSGNYSVKANEPAERHSYHGPDARAVQRMFARYPQTSAERRGRLDHDTNVFQQVRLLSLSSSRTTSFTVSKGTSDVISTRPIARGRTKCIRPSRVFLSCSSALK